MTRNRRNPPWTPLCAAALLAAALAGCAEPSVPEPTDTTPPPATVVVEEPAPRAAENPRLPAEKPRRQAALPPGDRPETRLPVLGPDVLVGLDRGQIALLLGAPLDVREQPPATVWSYRAQNCALNVFFYPDLQTREMRALAYDVRAGEETEQMKNACFATLRARAKE